MRSSSRRRASTCLTRIRALLIFGLGALLLAALPSHAQPTSQDPGARTAEAPPHDGLRYVVRTGSPRETLSSFQNIGQEFQAAYAEYRRNRDRLRADQLSFVVDQWFSLIDLSSVPVATREDVGALTAAYLLDIFDRIAPPDLGDVPNAADLNKGGPASYLIPGTPFRIVQIDSGPRQGEFLFSDRTVASAPGFFRTVETLPLRSAETTRSWVSEFRQLTGPLVPAALIEATPEALKRPVLGTPIWKIFAVAILMSLAALLLLLWGRATRAPKWGGLVGDRWRQLLTPLAMLLVALGLQYLFSAQIIMVGRFASGVYAALTILSYLAMAWGFWLLMLAAFETAIHRRERPETPFDANMLRLIARIIGIIGGVVILAYGAQDIGLPVFSLLAGLGIGGIAVALAIRPTLENLIGGFILYLDKPIRVGDFCTFGERSGTIESIGVRSTQIRALDRTLITVPNAAFADMQIVNWAQCDRMLINQTIGLRYETDLDQLRHVIVKLREMLIAHPRIDTETVRVRFGDYGASSLDVGIRIYALTREWNDFYAIKEDVLFRIKTIVEQSGSGFAFPSQTLYMRKDEGLDDGLAEKARQEVASWRRGRRLPFPNFAADRVKQLDGRLSYPPPGSPDFNATPEELEDAGGERLSAEPLQDDAEPPTEAPPASGEVEERP